MICGPWKRNAFPKERLGVWSTWEHMLKVWSLTCKATAFLTRHFCSVWAASYWCVAHESWLTPSYACASVQLYLMLLKAHPGLFHLIRYRRTITRLRDELPSTREASMFWLSGHCVSPRGPLTTQLETSGRFSLPDSVSNCPHRSDRCAIQQLLQEKINSLSSVSARSF